MPKKNARSALGRTQHGERWRKTGREEPAPAKNRGAGANLGDPQSGQSDRCRASPGEACAGLYEVLDGSVKMLMTGLAGAGLASAYFYYAPLGPERTTIKIALVALVAAQFVAETLKTLNERGGTGRAARYAAVALLSAAFLLTAATCFYVFKAECSGSKQNTCEKNTALGE